MPEKLPPPPPGALRAVRAAARIFRAAGIYGVLVLAPQYFLETQTSIQSPPPITHPEFYYGFVGVALAWQILFLVMARDPVRYRPCMIPAMLEKFSFAGATAVLFAQGRLSLLMFLGGLGDLVWGSLFVCAFVWTAPAAESH